MQGSDIEAKIIWPAGLSPLYGIFLAIQDRPRRSIPETVKYPLP
jgi:hypothetical protein